MERYLDDNLLLMAIGGNQKLPSQQELSSLIAETEINLLINNNSISPQLTEIAWYLFTIASIKGAYEHYGVERQRAAYQISGHIFDLALSSEEMSPLQKARYVFASQIAYLRSQHHPNAIAIKKKFLPVMPSPSLRLETYAEIALYAGIGTLAFDIRYVFDITNGIEDQAGGLSQDWAVGSLFETSFGAALGLAIGCRSLVSFLIYGKDSLLEKAKLNLHKAINCPRAYEDKDCIWMATLLLSLTDQLQTSSIWKVLPEEVPVNVKRAFTLVAPRVLSMWPPQVEYLRTHNPFSDDSKFQFISTPTSGGKTLLSQILIVHHLSARFTSACYVAPTRSLCREVTASMKERLRPLNLSAQIREAVEDFDLDEGDILEPTVDILTPEALANLIRKDPASVYTKYGLFVFDEVHSIGDSSRGWTLEQIISLLKTESATRDIRIAMISAVIGNRAHFISWLGNGGNRVLETHSAWRGPRRINAIWNTTVPDWRIEREEQIRPRTGGQFNRRTYHKLYGMLTVRTNANGLSKSMQTQEPLGELARRYRIDNPTLSERDSSKSLSHNESLLPLVNLLVARGPVLCIEATKPSTVSLAKAIAQSRPEVTSDQITELSQFIEGKLSNAHPLSKVIKHGVAYHHGSLPTDVRAEIEKAVIDGTITVLVATTTMTEGVNLPVQAVVISNVGSYQNDQEFRRYITGPKMANAIGRAGRATKETEGCVVLFHKGRPTPETFKALDPDDQDKWISSNLVTQDFINEVAAFEALKQATTDAVFECRSPILSGFFSFFWFYLYSISPDGEPTQEAMDAFLSNTMAWQQGTVDTKTAIQSLSNDLKAKYLTTATASRKVYSRSGSKLGTTRVLLQVFNSIKDDLTSDKSDIELIKTIFTTTTLPQIMSVAEAPSKPLYNHRSRGRTEIFVSPIAILEDWISGMSYPELADKYLSEVTDADYRFEQLGEYLTGYFDNFFPWVASSIVGWANDAIDVDDMLPIHLPGLIRGGVPNVVALVALHQGIYSRQLATNIATWKEQNHPETSRFRIRNELQKKTISNLTNALNPNPSELRNLIEFLAEDKARLLSDLTEHGTCKIHFWDTTDASPGICEIRGSGFRENYDIYRGTILLGSVPTMYHVEMRAFLTNGVPYVATATEDAHLVLSVNDFEPT